MSKRVIQSELITETHHLLHGKETWIGADAGYTGAQKREELKSLTVDWSIADKRSRVRAIENEALREVTINLERLKAKVRARVEHPFHVIKNLFGFKKVLYKGLKKNHAQCQVLFALANVFLVRKRLLA
jgi:transposase, IS5 family